MEQFLGFFLRFLERARRLFLLGYVPDDSGKIV
jgi:hypothetical protein